MTREGLIRHWDKVKAFKDGEDIQQFCSKTKKYIDEPCPSFGEFSKFRVKEKPAYVPFTYEDRDLFWGKSVETKKKDILSSIVSCHKSGLIEIGSEVLSFEKAFNLYVFSDGSPFGKQKETVEVKETVESYPEYKHGTEYAIGAKLFIDGVLIKIEKYKNSCVDCFFFNKEDDCDKYYDTCVSNIRSDNTPIVYKEV